MIHTQAQTAGKPARLLVSAPSPILQPISTSKMMIPLMSPLDFTVYFSATLEFEVGRAVMIELTYFYHILCAQSLQSCLLLRDPLDHSPPGSSLQGILQARILEWVAMPSSRGSFWPRDQTHVSCISCTAGGFFITEPQGCTPTNIQNTP